MKIRSRALTKESFYYSKIRKWYLRQTISINPRARFLSERVYVHSDRSSNRFASGRHKNQ